MKKVHQPFIWHTIVKDNGKFGIEDKNGYLLLPIEYDNIFVPNGIREGIGFILCKNGKFGYIEFVARTCFEEYEYGLIFDNQEGVASAFLPCIYDWIEGKTNGLAISSESEGNITDLWYDYKSHSLYRQVRWVHNFGDFDALLDFSHGPCIPELKRAGADEWVRFPNNRDIDFIEHIPTDMVGVTCIVCFERITENEEKFFKYPIDPENEAVFEAEAYETVVDEYVEYFFLLLDKNRWFTTPAKRTLTEIYTEIPNITKRHIQMEKEEIMDEKRAYSIIRKYNKYKKRNEA